MICASKRCAADGLFKFQVCEDKAIKRSMSADRGKARP